MAALAEYYSKKGEHDKARQYIERAHTLASEILLHSWSNKKRLGILAVQFSIAIREKKYPEALEAVAQMEKIIKEIYGEDNLVMQAFILLKKSMVYTESKGEEYKAEDNLKEFAKVCQKGYEQIEEGREESCLEFTYKVELMSGYLKIIRPEKAHKIYLEVVSALEAKGMQVSVPSVTVELLSLQTLQDPSQMEPQLVKI